MNSIPYVFNYFGPFLTSTEFSQINIDIFILTVFLYLILKNNIDKINFTFDYNFNKCFF